MPLDAAAKLQLEDIQRKFLRVAADRGHADQIGEAAVALAGLILEHCPASVERTTSLVYLDSAVLFAQAAILRHGE